MVLRTVAIFVFRFLVVGIFNIHTIQKTKIVTMLSAEKESDPELKKSRWIFVMVIILELFTVWAFITGAIKSLFFYDSRFPISVRLMYFGNIFSRCYLGWSFLWLLQKKKWDFQKLLCITLVVAILSVHGLSLDVLFIHSVACSKDRRASQQSR